MKPLIILDNGHGVESKGNRSPEWENGTQLLEYKYAREIVKGIAKRLEMHCIDYYIVVPEENNIPLKERCKRINKLARHRECLGLSIHANAGGGTGWEAWTYFGQSKSDTFANILYKEASKALKPYNFPIRKDISDGDADKEANFYILKHTICPFVLTENLFMDNFRDCRFMMSEAGVETMVDIHINAIKKYYEL